MDCLYVLQDLEAAGTKLRSPFLQHLFHEFSPSRSSMVQNAMIAFHPHDLNVGFYDYRAARHQFSDWLFGWNVSELSDQPTRDEHAIKSTDLNAGNTYGILRVPRDIDFFDKTERQECEKVIEAYTVQYTMSMRRLHQLCLRLEERLPLIGKNLANLSDEVDGGIDGILDEHSIWDSPMATNVLKDTNSNGTTHSTLSSYGLDHAEIGDQTIDSLNASLEKSKKVNTPQKINSARLSVDKTTNSRDGSGGLNSRSGLVNTGTPLPRIRSVSPRPVLQTNNSHGYPITATVTASGTALTEQNPLYDHNTTQGDTQMIANNLDPFQEPNAQIGKPMSSQTTNITVSKRPCDQEIIKKDIDLLFLDLSMTLDTYIACTISIVVVLAFSDLLVDKALFSKFASHAQNLCIELISTGIRIAWDLIKKASLTISIPNPTAAQLSDLKNLEQVMVQILKTRSYKPSDAIYLALSRMHAKFSVLHQLFVSVDVFLFPQMVPAHGHVSESVNTINAGNTGVKSMAETAFDKHIWVTGGYDCKIRIFDILEGTCLAQFTGHKSIVTEVQFVKNDTLIVSSSFDKTIKVWNAQTGSCERTFSGHSDSITACDVSSDARFVISGGLDQNLKLWDFGSGECISTTKKHARYIKCVKFSPDIRYAASAGLDRLVYIWDVKILAYSKNITHVRCIEAHDDYVLALDMQRPSLLVTASRDTKLKLWDYLTGHCIHCISLAPAWGCSVVFGHDAELLAAGCSDNSIHIIRTKTSERIRVLKALNSGVLAVRFPKRDYGCIMIGTQEGFLQKLHL